MIDSADILIRARKLLSRFARASGGNVAMTFALATLPVIGGVGAAVDYSRANSAKASLQAAIDAAGLILSKDAQTLSQAQLDLRADALVRGNLNHPGISNLKVVPVFATVDSGSFSLKLSADAQVPTSFTAMWQPTLAVGARTEVVWGMKRLELVLALDNTGSMSSSNKMNQLKLAAKDLLKTLQDAAKKPDDIKVGIVPFATDVNIGRENVYMDWVRWDEWEDANGSCSSSSYKTKSSCEKNKRTWTVANKKNWNGCVWDRDKDYDVTNTSPSITDKPTMYYAHQAEACPASMLQLTNGWSTLNNKIEEMTPKGNTNVTIGLQMAFQMLSPVSPFNAAAPKNDLDKVIILLTDGDNTESHWSTSQKSIDDRTRRACNNVKAANIKLYTVRVINGNATLLRDCATKSDMYYDVQNASQLSAVFSTIAKNLANLRLVK